MKETTVHTTCVICKHLCMSMHLKRRFKQPLPIVLLHSSSNIDKVVLDLVLRVVFDLFVLDEAKRVELWLEIWVRPGPGMMQGQFRY